MTLLVEHNINFGLIIILGGIVYAIGRRMARTKIDYYKMSRSDRYVGPSLSAFISMIVFWLPYVISDPVFEEHWLLGLTAMSLSLVIVVSIFKGFFGIVMIIGGPRSLRENGEDWR